MNYIWKSTKESLFYLCFNLTIVSRHLFNVYTSSRYESLVGSMKKKFAKKRDRSAIEEDANQTVTETNKKIFLKPQD